MSPPPIRRMGLLDRRLQRRDARLVFVACEDTFAVRQYFEALEHNAVVDARRVSVHVIPTDAAAGQSDPRSVKARLDRLTRDLDLLRPMDERWLCLDVDHWATGRHAPNLARACKEALEAGYQLAISNPAFEVWLLLHFVEQPRSTQAECEAAIRDAVGSYAKNSLQPQRYTAERVAQAIERARALDVDHTQRWPQQPGSQVYRLVERLPRRS
ncbi:MAG: RloB family protein [Nannocystaceae bacterium]